MSNPFPPFSDLDTSLDAAMSVASKTETVRQRVLSFIKERGTTGATCDEVEIELGMPHQTASARLWELRKMDLATDDMKGVRLTRTGRRARVWMAYE